MEHAAEQEFGVVKQRLETIAEAVENPDMPLEEALDLFEEDFVADFHCPSV